MLTLLNMLRLLTNAPSACSQLSQRKAEKKGKAKKMSNQFCTTCKQSYTALNGCYCTMLNRYVEHATIPPCSTHKKEKK